MNENPMEIALRAWLKSANKNQDATRAAQAAAEALSQEPWDVVKYAGSLARTQLRFATQDLGLTAALRIKEPGQAGVILTVEKGAPYPAKDNRGKRKRGASGRVRS